MKRKLSLFIFLVIVLGCLALAACNDVPVYNDEIASPSFSDAEFVYDGEAKTIAVSGLPEGAKVTYIVNGVKAGDTVSVTEPGEYNVVAEITLSDDYEPVADMTAKLIVKKVAIDMSGVCFAKTSGTYTGSAIEPEIANLPDGVDVYYVYTDAAGNEIEEMVNAGEYSVTAFFNSKNSAHYEIAAGERSLSATFTVNKATISLSGVSFIGKTVTYDGNAIERPGASNLPSNTSVSYSVKKGDAVVSQICDAGTYTVVATFASTNANYEIAAGEGTKSVTVTVDPKPVDVSDVIMEDTSIPYTGAPILVLQDLPEGVTVKYAYASGDGEETLAAIISVGTYSVTATLLPANDNYRLSGDTSARTATVEITKQVISLAEACLENGSAKYNGEELIHAAFGGFDASLFDIVYTYEKDGVAVDFMKDAGTYTVTATITLKDDRNYAVEDGCELPWVLQPATFVIEKQSPDLSGIEFEDQERLYNEGEIFTYEATGVLPEGYTVSYTYTLNDAAVEKEMTARGVYTITAIFTPADTDNYETVEMSVTFKIADDGDTLDLGAVTLPTESEDLTGEYNGESHTVTVEGLPEGIDVRYVYTLLGENGEDVAVVDAMIAAGTYRVDAYFTSDIYVWSDEKALIGSVTYTIIKKTVDLSGVIFADGSCVYDGTEKDFAEAIDDTDLFDVTYTVEGDRVNAGSFKVTATFTLKDTANYTFAEGATTATKTITVVIAPQERELDPEAKLPVLSGGSSFYDGVIKTLVAEGYDPEYLKVNCKYYLNEEEVDGLLNAGDYKIVATVDFVDTNYTIAGGYTITVYYTINKKAVHISGASLNIQSAVYNGAAKEVSAIGYDSAIFSVTYERYFAGAQVEEMINAGVYVVKVNFSLVDPDNYEFIGDQFIMQEFTVRKASISLSSVAFPKINYTPYTGEPIAYELVNLPEGVVAQYIYNGSSAPMVAAGRYNVIAMLSSDNYEIPDRYALFTAEFIVQAEISLDGVAFGNVTGSVYDGKNKTVELANLPSGVVPSFTYTKDGVPVTSVKDAGTYKVIVTFAKSDATSIDYYVDTTQTLEGEYTVLRKTISFEMQDGEAAYDGKKKEHKGIADALPSDVKVIYTYYYANNMQPMDMVASATYKVVATLSNDNYVFEGGETSVTVTFEIK